MTSNPKYNLKKIIENNQTLNKPFNHKIEKLNKNIPSNTSNENNKKYYNESLFFEQYKDDENLGYCLSLSGNNKKNSYVGLNFNNYLNYFNNNNDLSNYKNHQASILLKYDQESKSGDLEFFTSPSPSDNNKYPDSEKRMTITKNGSVCIGTNKINDDCILNVKGNVDIKGSLITLPQNIYLKGKNIGIYGNLTKNEKDNIFSICSSDSLNFKINMIDKSKDNFFKFENNENELMKLNNNGKLSINGSLELNKDYNKDNIEDSFLNTNLKVSGNNHFFNANDKININASKINIFKNNNFINENSINISGDIFYYNIHQVIDTSLLQENSTINNVLDKINLINGVNYYIQNGEKIIKKVGIKDKDLEKILPELFNRIEEDKFSLDTNGLIIYLIESIKELNYENTLLKEKFKEQEYEIKNIKEKLNLN